MQRGAVQFKFARFRFILQNQEWAKKNIDLFSIFNKINVKISHKYIKYIQFIEDI